MCIPVVSGVLLDLVERFLVFFFAAQFCFDIINHKNIVAPRCKRNNSEDREGAICLHHEPDRP